MPQTDLSAQLARAERSVDEVSQALANGQPELVASATRELHQCAVALSGVLQRLNRDRPALDQQFRRRLGKVAQAIAMQREACARHAAAVERSLHSIVPATRASTYAGASGAAYARNVKQSGVFKLLAA